MFLNPRAVEIEHYGVGTFVGIRDVRHKTRIGGISAVRFSRVIKVDNEELFFLLHKHPNDGANDCRQSLRGREICSRRCTSQNLFLSVA